MFARSLDVSGPAEYNGVRVDDPAITSGIETLVKKGYNNQHICRIIGMPQEVVDRVRHQLKERERK